jgi:hypothetical protein
VAAKGGGQWKVAYADFVTAMMAFFLVMWITAQDQKIKQAVARYFNNPMNFESVGQSTKPDKTGSALPMPSTGQVPLQDSVAMGQGRHSYSQPAPKSPQTKAVADWIHSKQDQLQHWLREAERSYWLAAQSPRCVSNVGPCAKSLLSSWRVASARSLPIIYLRRFPVFTRTCSTSPSVRLTGRRSPKTCSPTGKVPIRPASS